GAEPGRRLGGGGAAREGGAAAAGARRRWTRAWSPSLRRPQVRLRDGALGPRGGQEEYIVNALTLGCSLRQTNTKHDMVLLATPDLGDLLNHASACALSAFWDVRQQEHLDVSLETRCAPRFRRVFTKLSVMKLTEYEKVLMLDADMLVTR
ncbi:unnamed protein product, partial [Prorocentrum cordatum]